MQPALHVTTMLAPLFQKFEWLTVTGVPLPTRRPYEPFVAIVFTTTCAPVPERNTFRRLRSNVQPTTLADAVAAGSIRVPAATSCRNAEFERVTVLVPVTSTPRLLLMPRSRSYAPVPAFVVMHEPFVSKVLFVTASV